MSRLRKILYIISWSPALAAKAILWFIGLFVVAYCVRKNDQSTNWPNWAELWGNLEEGYPIKSGVSAWWWYAMRNPVNNSRYIFKDRVPEIETNWEIEHEFDFPEYLPMEPGEMAERWQMMAYRWAWSGPFAGYRRVWIHKPKTIDDDFVIRPKKYSEFWIGWKVGSKVPGMGLTLQLRRNRKIGR